MSKKDKENRRDSYKRLKEAGFNSYEANRFKDFSPNKMNRILEHKRELQEAIDHVIKSKKPHD